MINIVITMGGNGSRFRKVGYNLPKYMIEAKGKTLFEWSMISLEGFKREQPRYIFIVKAEDKAQDFIYEKCDTLGIKIFDVVELDSVTDGQATTAIYAAPYCDHELPFMIFNIDTYIEPDVFSNMDINCDGWIPCFDAPGESWSFVKLNQIGQAIEVREKDKISNHATVGIYWFKSFSLYLNLYNVYYANVDKIEKGEKYVAPLYNQLIHYNGDVRIFDVPYAKVHVLGTPEELAIFISENS